MKWGWIVAACLLAGWLAARRHRQGRRLQIAELVAIAVALLIGLGVVHLPNLEKLIEDAGTALGPWTYLLVGFLAFAETGAFLGFVAPGETAVIVGGFVAGQGKISPWRTSRSMPSTARKSPKALTRPLARTASVVVVWWSFITI